MCFVKVRKDGYSNVISDLTLIEAQISRSGDSKEEEEEAAGRVSVIRSLQLLIESQGIQLKGN